MKVAIMGAGLSGLSCAIVLERNGIKPHIFEKRRTVGDRFVNGEILLSALNRPVRDSIAFLAEKYAIYLQPLGNIRQVVIHSAGQRAEINGRLGFTNLRGRARESFENQLARQVTSKITYNSRFSYEELSQEYTHVVVATGDAAYAAAVQDYDISLRVSLRGGTVRGRFDRHSVGAWLNNELAPGGYAYLIPLSDTEANIVTAYPDYEANKDKDPGRLWQLLYNEVCSRCGQQLAIIDQFSVTGYIIGICRYPRIGNTFFTGNCFGSIMPFLGFGQFASILTGVYAAMDICGQGSYEHLTKRLRQAYHNSLVLRRALERMDNNRLDLLVKSLKGRAGRLLFDSRYDLFKLASYLLRPVLAAVR